MSSYLYLINGSADFTVNHDARSAEARWPLAPDQSGRLLGGNTGTVTAQLIARHDPIRGEYVATVRQIIAYPHGSFHVSRPLRDPVPRWEVSRAGTRYSRAKLVEFAGEAVGQLFTDGVLTVPPSPAVAAAFTVQDPA